MQERFGKLQIREEKVSFGPPASIKFIHATLLASKLQIQERNNENEWYIYDLQCKQKRYAFYEVEGLSLWTRKQLKKTGHFLYIVEAVFGLDFPEISNKILKSINGIY